MVPPRTRALPTRHFTNCSRREVPNEPEGVRGFRDLRRRQARQHIREIVLRVQATPPATDQDGINHGAAPSRLGVANEEPALAAHRRGANVILDQIVVNLKASVVQIPDQGRVLVEQVIHRLAQSALR